MAGKKNPTPKQRKSMPASQFGVPDKKKYPIDTTARARNALARVSQHGTSTEKQQVRQRVAKKYPSIKVAGTKSKGK